MILGEYFSFILFLKRISINFKRRDKSDAIAGTQTEINKERKHTRFIIGARPHLGSDNPRRVRLTTVDRHSTCLLPTAAPTAYSGRVTRVIGIEYNRYRS
ncbi:hypothetical protein EVAR_51027_1 [Eumeta japonica]|uniref:Uncharacterized protein n=1 Tax=Eumeta variegata TaxID=151549 RepID=A0A4C1Y4A5_EUMVA|nr:hypothetical protein EVAR_51027_1 [Eumeta japonica]